MSNYKLPEGYKQTKIGLIPEDWKVEKFQDITEVITCGLAATPKYVTEAKGKPFLSAQNVRDGKVVYENYKFVSKELFAQITRHNKPSRGDILYTRVGAGIGDAGVIENDFEFAIYVSLTLIKLKYDKADSYFISNLLNSERYKFLAKNGLFAGAGVQNLNVEVVRNFAIPLPPLPEQRAIARALSDADTLIAALDKQLAKKRHIKTATMQQLLTGKKRLPGFGEGKGYKKTNFGVIPEDWNVVPITKATGEIFLGLTAKVDYVNSGGIPLIRASDIASGRLSFSDARAISVRQHKELTRYRRPKQGDVLVSKSGSLGVCAIVDVDREFSIYESIIVIQSNSLLNSNFLLWLVRDERTQIRMIGEKVGSTVGHLNLEMFRKLIIPLPTIEEQRAIAQVLTDIDTDIAALENRRAKTQAIKQGMMQELLTGRTRLI